MKTRVALAVTLVVMAANLATFGGVGDILFAVGDAITGAIFGDSLGDFHGDFYWPISIWMGLAWPVGALLIYHLMMRHRAGKRWTSNQYLLFPACLFVLLVILSAAFRFGAATMSPDFEVQEWVPGA